MCLSKLPSPPPTTQTQTVLTGLAPISMSLSRTAMSHCQTGLFTVFHTLIENRSNPSSGVSDCFDRLSQRYPSLLNDMLVHCGVGSVSAACLGVKNILVVPNTLLTVRKRGTGSLSKQYKRVGHPHEHATYVSVCSGLNSIYA